MAAHSIAEAACPKCKAVGYMGWHALEDSYECGKCRAVVGSGEVVWPNSKEANQ